MPPCHSRRRLDDPRGSEIYSRHHGATVPICTRLKTSIQSYATSIEAMLQITLPVRTATGAYPRGFILGVYGRKRCEFAENERS